MNAMNAHENPYREGDSRVIFDYMMTKQSFTRKELVEYVMKELGKSETAAKAQVQTLISPRKKSARGDCRGQVSAQGHIYYIEKIRRLVRYGIREPQRLRLRWREEALERRWRNEPIRLQIRQEKSAAKEAKREKVKALARVRALSKQLARVQAELMEMGKR
jgi:hypothetical protein